ncbi:phage tail terminator protein [Variovorax sp. RHLX14]|uniref:phage tail terminator protein n=1 Tax=Variovorax sp. RHLX14 TaxID=1259731 RepID=UPI003F47384B
MLGDHALVMEEQLHPYGRQADARYYRLGKRSQAKAAGGKKVDGRFMSRVIKGGHQGHRGANGRRRAPRHVCPHRAHELPEPRFGRRRMNLEFLAIYLASKGLGKQAETLFADEMPTDCKEGVLLRNGYDGTPINHYMRGHIKDEFRVAIRALTYGEGYVLANQVAAALTADREGPLGPYIWSKQCLLIKEPRGCPSAFDAPRCWPASSRVEGQSHLRVDLCCRPLQECRTRHSM